MYGFRACRQLHYHRQEMKKSVQSCKFTTEQLADLWHEQRAVQNLMGKYSNYYLLLKEKDIFADFWSKEADVCLGLNDGYYKGAEAIKGYYDAYARMIGEKSKLMQELFPEKLGGLSGEEIYGVGQIEYIPLTSPLVEIAADGKTAKGIWMSQGCMMDITKSGPVGYWKLSCIAADLIKEDGQWKVWHLLMLDEINTRQGQSWVRPNEEFPELEEFEVLKSLKLPEPNVACSIRKKYSADREHEELPRLPEAYDTFADTFNYGV